MLEIGSREDAPGPHATGEARGDAIEGRQNPARGEPQGRWSRRVAGQCVASRVRSARRAPFGSSTDAFTPVPPMSIARVVNRWVADLRRSPGAGGREPGSFVASGSLTSNSLTESLSCTGRSPRTANDETTVTAEAPTHAPSRGGGEPLRRPLGKVRVAQQAEFLLANLRGELEHFVLFLVDVRSDQLLEVEHLGPRSAHLRVTLGSCCMTRPSYGPSTTDDSDSSDRVAGSRSRSSPPV